MLEKILEVEAQRVVEEENVKWVKEKDIEVEDLNYCIDQKKSEMSDDLGVQSYLSWESEFKRHGRNTFVT